MTDWTGGAIGFGGGVTAIGGADNGISFGSNTGGLTTFSGTVGVNAAGVNNALTLSGNAALPVSFTGTSSLTARLGQRHRHLERRDAGLLGHDAQRDGAALALACRYDGGGTIVVTGTGIITAASAGPRST